MTRPIDKSVEVEIARICIQSTSDHVVCLYGRALGCRITYRMADEYDGRTLENPSTRTSMRPLTMGELMAFFLTSWSLFTCLDWNYDNELMDKLAFFGAESEYHPYFDDALREQEVLRGQHRAKEPQC